MVTGVLLAGGESRRMGTDKALLEIRGERLLDRTVRLFQDLFPQVILVTNQPLAYLDQPVEIVTDVLPGRGPLGGLYTGLFFASHPYIFCVACDMPYLNAAFIRHLLTLRDAYDVVVPRTPDGLQPLHALYSRRCLPRIEKQLAAEKLKISGFYKGLKVLTVPPEVSLSFDPVLGMFYNINRPEDLTAIRPAP